MYMYAAFFYLALHLISKEKKEKLISCQERFRYGQIPRDWLPELTEKSQNPETSILLEVYKVFLRKVEKL